jgi:hypothetical protein
MLQMTLDLTGSSRLWTFQLQGFEVFQVRLQKKATSTVSIEIHKGAIFDLLKIKVFVTSTLHIFSIDDEAEKFCKKKVWLNPDFLYEIKKRKN